MHFNAHLFAFFVLFLTDADSLALGPSDSVPLR